MSQPPSPTPGEIAAHFAPRAIRLATLTPEEIAAAEAEVRANDPTAPEAAVGARYGVPFENGHDALTECRAWFGDREEGLTYARMLGGELWDMVEGVRAD